MTENPDARPEPIHVVEFEGEYVRAMSAKLPAINLEMPEGYRRGTHLKLEVEVRVRNVRYEEILRGENKGELVREHLLTLEEVKLLSAHSADEVDLGVGGSAGQPAWREALLSYLVGDIDELDFEGEEIPERLRELLEAAHFAEGVQGAPSYALAVEDPAFAVHSTDPGF